MKLIDTDRDRGQVGIGTLIVFIAMVLVAAIAAGVLVDTAGFLQSKSQQTGEDSTNSVTNRVQVVDTYGVIKKLDPDDGSTNDDPNGGDSYNAYYLIDSQTDTGDTGSGDDIYRAYYLNFVVMRSAGSDNIQLDKVVLMWQGPDGATETTLSSSDRVSITAIEGASNNVLAEQKDRARIQLELDPGDDGASSPSKKGYPLDALKGGEEVTIKFTTVSGATVRKTVSMPSTYPSTDGAIVSL